MKKSWIAAAALLIGLSFAAPAAWAGRTAAIDQSGDGKFTVLMQDKRNTLRVTRNNMSQQEINQLVPVITRAQAPIRGGVGSKHCAAGVQPRRGGMNNAAVIQAGIGNSAKVNQSGTGNQAAAVQVGNNNKSYILQRGTGHSAEAVQTGNNNTAIIIQKC